MVRRVAVATMRETSPRARGEGTATVASLKALGVDAQEIPWDDPSVRWSDFDACIVRTTWDYTSRVQEFLAWADRVARETSLWNPVEVLRWNAHKSYLLDMKAHGVTIPPTACVAQGEAATLHDIMDARGWSEVVVKPAVDAAARGALRVAPGNLGAGEAHLRDLAAKGDALVQPLIPSVLTQGETSLVFFNGTFSHAVVKVPRSGDYRVQADWGGTLRSALPRPDQMEAAQRVLACTPGPTLHARVDLADLPDGTPALMELEVIEPALFLELSEGAAQRLARAIVDRLAGAVAQD